MELRMQPEKVDSEQGQDQATSAREGTSGMIKNLNKTNNILLIHFKVNVPFKQVFTMKSCIQQIMCGFVLQD